MQRHLIQYIIAALWSRCGCTSNSNCSAVDAAPGQGDHARGFGGGLLVMEKLLGTLSFTLPADVPDEQD
jgi:hypothetical protein